MGTPGLTGGAASLLHLLLDPARRPQRTGCREKVSLRVPGPGGWFSFAASGISHQWRTSVAGALRTPILERTNMKVKTNLRAGSGGSANSGGASGNGHNSSGDSTSPVPVYVPPVYVPPVSRCVGI
jgi:hypothetical protein